MSPPEEILKHKTLLIDGSSFIYRAYYAITGYLATSKGFPTKAIFGVTQMLLKILKEWDPENIVWFMDEKGPTFRHLQYEEYKATRPGMPDDLKIQIPFIKEIVSALGIPVVSAEGFEADDLICSFIKTFPIPLLMVAPDKDLLSLIDERVVAYDPVRESLMDLESFQQKYGFPPSSFPHFRALAGDPSDNIKGIPGIGEKTARELIKKFKTLENLYAHIDEITPLKLREKLKEFKEIPFKNLELMKLREDAPLPSKELAFYRRKTPDLRELKRLFKEFEFRKFLKELSFPEEELDFTFEEVSPQKLLEILEKREKISLYLEKGAPTLFGHTTSSLAIALSPQEAYLSTFDPRLWEVLKVKEVILHDYKGLLHQIGAPLERVRDVKIAAYLLNPGLKNYALANLSIEYLDYPLKEGGTGAQKSILLYLLGEEFEKELKKEGLWEWFEKVEVPLSEVLYTMEKRGIRIDVEYVKKLKDDFTKRIKEIEEKLFAIAGTTFNPRSSQEVGVILFEKLRLPKIKKTQKSAKPSTDAEVLEELSNSHPIVPLLLEYRTLYKLQSTYLEVFLKEVSPSRDRLHTEFNPTGTATGRLSSQRPNLQNIPVKGEEGLAIRRAFIAEEGSLILSLDYSQIELRILAHFSQDANLLRAFESGEDIHSHTASEVFGVAMDKVTPEMRRVAKVINFGIAYGMSPYGLSKELKIDSASAEAYIKKYFARYPGVKEYIDRTIEFAREHGFVRTLAGRKRFIPEILSPNRNIREFGQRMAVNTPIQGSAADLIKAAMVALFRALEREGLKSRIILQVHDELLLESPEDEIERVSPLAKSIMEDPFPYLGINLKLTVPIKVNVSSGKSWADCK